MYSAGLDRQCRFGLALEQMSFIVTTLKGNAAVGRDPLGSEKGARQDSDPGSKGPVQRVLHSLVSNFLRPLL